MANLDADYLVLRTRVAESHPDLLPLYDTERDAVIETMRAVAATSPEPSAPAPAEPFEEAPAPPPGRSVDLDLVRRIAEDALTGPRPLEPEEDPYGLREVSYAANRNDADRTHALTLLAARYGVDFDTFEAAVLALLQPQGDEPSAYRGLTTLRTREPGSNNDWMRDGVLHALADLTGEAPGAYSRDFFGAALRTLDLRSRFKSKESLLPVEKMPDSLRRALTRISPRSATMVQFEPSNPVWAIEAKTALGHIQRMAQRRAREDERYRHQYPYTPQDLEDARRWFEAHVNPSTDARMLRGRHNNAVRGNETDPVRRMACAARWFLPRYGSAAGDRDAPFPPIHTNSYRASPTIGDLLLDDLDWFREMASLPDTFLSGASADERAAGLSLAGYRFRPASRETRPAYDGPLSEDRIYGWLCGWSGSSYGDNPWSIQVEPGVARLVYRPYPTDPTPFVYDVRFSGKGQRAALTAVAQAATALWRAFVQYELRRNKDAYAHIFTALHDDVLYTKREWSRPVPEAPSAPSAPPAPEAPSVLDAALATSFCRDDKERALFAETFTDESRTEFTLPDFADATVQGENRLVAYWWMPDAADGVMRDLIETIKRVRGSMEHLPWKDARNLRRSVYAVFLHRLVQVTAALTKLVESYTLDPRVPDSNLNREVYRRIVEQTRPYAFNQNMLDAMLAQAASHILGDKDASVYASFEEDGFGFPGADLVRALGKAAPTEEDRLIAQYGPLDPTPADDKSAYFVSARKSGDGVGILLDGPFETHREAVLAIPSVRSHPRVEQDPSFMFGEALIGTARAPRGSPVALRPAPEAPSAPSGPPPLPPLYQTETYLSNYGKSTSKEVPRGAYAYKLAGVVHSPTAEAAMIEQGWKILPTRGGGSYTHAIPPESGAQSTQTKRDTKAVVIKAVAPTEAAFDAWADAVYAYFLAHPVEKPHSVRVSPTLIWSYTPPRVERWRTETSSYDGRAPEISEHVRYRGAEIRLFTGAGLIEREWRHPEDPTPAPSHMTYPRTRANRIKWPSSVHPASGSFASGGFASGSFASGVHDRLGRETTRLFGRDLSGGAEWSTDGAWRVAPGRYLVRVDEDWFVVQRKPDGEGGYIDTDLTPALRWGDAVRVAKGGDHGASASTDEDQRERLERMRAFAASHGFHAVVRGDRLEVHVPFGNRGEPPSIEYASTFSELRAILGY